MSKGRSQKTMKRESSSERKMKKTNEPVINEPVIDEATSAEDLARFYDTYLKEGDAWREKEEHQKMFECYKKAIDCAELLCRKDMTKGNKERLHDICKYVIEQRRTLFDKNSSDTNFRGLFEIWDRWADLCENFGWKEEWSEACKGRYKCLKDLPPKVKELKDAWFRAYKGYHKKALQALARVAKEFGRLDEELGHKVTLISYLIDEDYEGDKYHKDLMEYYEFLACGFQRKKDEVREVTWRKEMGYCIDRMYSENKTIENYKLLCTELSKLGKKGENVKEYYSEVKILLERKMKYMEEYYQQNAESNSDVKLVEEYRKLGSSLLKMKRGSAYQWLLKVLEYDEKQYDEKKDKEHSDTLYYTYRRIGQALSNLRKHPEALQYYKKAEKCLDKKDKSIETRLGRAVLDTDMQFSYGVIGNYREAIYYCKRAVKLLKKICKEESTKTNYKSLASSYYSLGALYWNIGLKGKNRICIKKAKKMSKRGE